MLRKEDIALYCWGFPEPLAVDDKSVIDLMEFLDMATGMTIPLPGTDGWELVHADPDAFYRVDDLADVRFTGISMWPKFAEQAGVKQKFRQQIASLHRVE